MYIQSERTNDHYEKITSVSDYSLAFFCRDASEDHCHAAMTSQSSSPCPFQSFFLKLILDYLHNFPFSVQLALHISICNSSEIALPKDQQGAFARMNSVQTINNQEFHRRESVRLINWRRIFVPLGIGSSGTHRNFCIYLLVSYCSTKAIFRKNK